MTNKEIFRFLKDNDMYCFYKPLLILLQENCISLSQFWSDMYHHNTQPFRMLFNGDVKTAFLKCYKLKKPLSCLVDCVLWRDTCYSKSYTSMFIELGNTYADF